jgi:hypothetical protein
MLKPRKLEMLADLSGMMTPVLGSSLAMKELPLSGHSTQV